MADDAFQILATVTVDEFTVGAKSIFSFTIPDHKSGKVISCCAGSFHGR